MKRDYSKLRQLARDIKEIPEINGRTREGRREIITEIEKREKLYDGEVGFLRFFPDNIVRGFIPLFFGFAIAEGLSRLGIIKNNLEYTTAVVGTTTILLNQYGLVLNYLHPDLKHIIHNVAENNRSLRKTGKPVPGLEEYTYESLNL